MDATNASHNFGHGGRFNDMAFQQFAGELFRFCDIIQRWVVIVTTSGSGGYIDRRGGGGVIKSISRLREGRKFKIVVVVVVVVVTAAAAAALALFAAAFPVRTANGGGAIDWKIHSLGR